MIAYVIAAGLLGLIFGSFATVAAHRIPRRESIVTGRSKCPNCGRTITASENIPVASYLIQRGRCRGCGYRISVRYPAIELATRILFAVAAAKFELSVEAVVYAGFFWALVVLSVIDQEHKLLPNRVVFPTFAAGLVGLAVAALADDAPERIARAGLGALVFGGFFFVVIMIVPRGMGGGDMKLGFVLGLFLGYLGTSIGNAIGMVLVGMFLSFFLGGIGGLVMLSLGRGRKSQIRFGPFLALGAVSAIVVGQRILDAYLGTF